MDLSETVRERALDRAVRKAYWRLLPLLFLCYVIAYIDRVNVGFAKLNMQKDLEPQGFTESVFGFGMGIFFLGYLLLEIPGTLLVERWSARKWICRIMVTWGVIAALTAFVREPWQFYTVRFLLGLAEAGFFPGVIVYLTHWFPSRDRTRALAWFLIGTPIAQMVAPPLSEVFMGIGVGDRPPVLGLVGWQWVFIVWGIPAVVLGIVVLATLTDRPRHAGWLSEEERTALEGELERERAEQKARSGHMGVLGALKHPKVLALAAAYFFVVTGNYGVELYMASILQDWYGLDVKKVAYLIIIPPIGSLIGQLFIGWSSDRTRERRWHAALPIVMGALALFLAPASQGQVAVTVGLFTVAMTGLKAYLPAFWALPSLLMTESAAAASIGMINSFGNLGGWVGPSVLGFVKQATQEYRYGLWFLGASMLVSALIIVNLGIGRRAAAVGGRIVADEALPEPA
ncbi:MAG: MFS transporter [Isosphaeraceae bacterium]|jgi:ACS family tartrate transporter-like MFS transporter|nr:MAG: MFS transporter [Isosphaeraceae bacterium]